MNPRLAKPVIVAAILLQLGIVSAGSARGQQTCQPNDFSLSMAEAEWNSAADDFRPLGTTITSVTVWGAYVSWNSQGEMVDCSSGEPDNFIIRVFSESPAAPIPGSILATRAASISSKSEVPPQGGWVGGPLKLWSYVLLLASPIDGLDDSGATTYWLMVENDTWNPPDDDCWWRWLYVDTNHNQHSVFGYWNWPPNNPLALRTKDFAFCLDIEFETPPTPLAPCCECSGGCEMTTQLACESSGRHWRFGEVACMPGLCPAGPPPNDSCATAIDLPYGGGNLVNNYCATTDGPSPVPTESGSVAVENDVWYRVIVSEVDYGDLNLDLCSSGLAGDGVMDSVVSVYHDPENPTQCVCPDESDPDAYLWPAGQSVDDNCSNMTLHGSGSTSGFVCGGYCFVVRVSGAAGRPASTGEVVMDHFYTQPTIASSPTVSDSTCLGGASAGAECGVDGDCPGGKCHSKSRFLSIGPGGDVPCTDVPDNTPSALQVKVVSAPDAGMVGDVWWAGQDQPYADVGGTTFRASRLECTSSPVVKQWVVDKPLHLYGQAVVPGATYEVRRCATLTGPCTSPLLIQTGSWGDIVPPLGTPNFADISACVGTFTGTGNAPSRTRSKLQPALIDPSIPVSFADISLAVGAFMGQSYPFPPAQCP